MRSRKSGLYSLYVLMGILLLFSISVGPKFVKAQRVSDYPDIKVNRTIEIEDGGAIVVNDSVTLSCDVARNVRPLDGFQIGFPSQYQHALAYYSAHDAEGRLQTVLVTSSNGGFLWMNISFAQPIDVSDGGLYDFTAIFVFSRLTSANRTLFHADFPAYPSLMVEAKLCNVTVVLPNGASLNGTSPGFSNKIMDSRLVLYIEKAPLAAYSNVSSWVDFTAANFLLLEVDRWERELKLDGLGDLLITDLYHVTTKAESFLTKMSFVLPPNATDVSAQDVYGALEKVTIVDRVDYTEAKVPLRGTLLANQKVKLLIIYRLPLSKYVAQRGWQDYTLNVSLARPDKWVLGNSTVTVVLPEGAEFQTSSKTLYRIEREGFLVKIKFEEKYVTQFYEKDINLEYRYLILWASFRPTLWVGTIAVILGGVFFMRKTSKPEVVVVMPISPEIVRTFIDKYEERRRLESELESLEQRVQKGKLSRRRYKLQKSSLDGRISRLQRELEGHRTEIAAAGSRYSERMRQLETAETEIETLTKDIERVEVRFRRREMSAEARRRLLDEYNRIRERAENTIAEILLRLREEIR